MFTLSRMHFKETGQFLCGSFLEYWKAHGALPQQGYPISDEFVEKSELDGKTYTAKPIPSNISNGRYLSFTPRTKRPMTYSYRSSAPFSIGPNIVLHPPVPHCWCRLFRISPIRLSSRSAASRCMSIVTSHIAQRVKIGGQQS